MDVLAGSTISATLVWDRIVSTDTEDIDSVVYSFDHLDNLDLFLYDVDDPTTPSASSISGSDNVEHIVYTVGESGRYMISVSMTGAAPGDLGDFALAWELEPGALMGDANLNGYVDDNDLSLLLANWHASTDWQHGNFSDDDPFGGTIGFVDDNDLSLLLANWHVGSPPLGGAAVPEPATLAFLLLGFAGLMRRRRKE